MMLKKISLPNILFVVIIIILALYIFKPNLYKQSYKYLTKGLKQEQKISQQTLDSLEAIRQSDYLLYIDKLDSINKVHEIRLKELNNAYLQETYKRKQNEKEFNDYINSDFDKRFFIFSSTYNKQDPD